MVAKIFFGLVFGLVLLLAAVIFTTSFWFGPLGAIVSVINMIGTAATTPVTQAMLFWPAAQWFFGFCGMVVGALLFVCSLAVVS